MTTEPGTRPTEAGAGPNGVGAAGTNPGARSDETPQAESRDAALDELAGLAAGQAPDPSREVTAEDEAERLRQELEEARERLLRAQADLENLRKRTRRELEEERRFANLPLLTDLLPVIDNVGRAIQAAEKAAEGGALLEGVKLVAQQLDSVLTRHHCKRIAALGGPFDPHLHQAIVQQPSAEHPAGTVLVVAQEGYQLHDRVLRPAQVVVSSASAPAGRAED
ncbi:MAG TPA: nucleotide exchange factor GrpE [Pirellulales bacterium]|jgi:molecular chaperone GrpE|nr:nucleotide exchange factor GrpE [Pirellulales bacterium]